MHTWVLNMEFKADDDWRPLDAGCWVNCPLACLTKLSHTCHAKERFDKDKSVICPMEIYAEQKVEEDAMKEQIKYDIDDEVLVNFPELEAQKVGTISMILVNRKGIQYRAKFGYDKQYTFSQDDVISKVESRRVI